MAESVNLQGVYHPPVPSRITFGRGKVAELGEEVDQLGGKRVLVLSGKTIAERTTGWSEGAPGEPAPKGQSAG